MMASLGAERIALFKINVSGTNCTTPAIERSLRNTQDRGSATLQLVCDTNLTGPQTWTVNFYGRANLTGWSVRQYDESLSVLAAQQLNVTQNQTGANESLCRIIDTPGAYNLAGNAIGAPYAVAGQFAINNACIVIASSDVTFNCLGYNITNNNTAFAAGILVNGTSMDYSNVTIQNCTGITGYSYGVSIQSSENVTLANMTLFNSTNASFMTYETNNVYVQNVSSSNNGEHGFIDINSNRTFYSNDTAYNNTVDGFNLDHANFSSFANSSASYNGRIGFNVDGTNLTNFTNTSSTFNGEEGYFLEGSWGVQFINNFAGDNLGQGLFISADAFASSHLIQNFTANDNNVFGLLIYGSNNNTIVESNFTSQAGGIMIMLANDTHIINSSSSTNDVGLFITNATGTMVDPSYFCDNANVGIFVNSSFDTIIDDSVVCRNGMGIVLNLSNNTLLNRSSVYNNSAFGIFSENTNYSNFTNSNITNNTAGGIRLDSASSNTDLYSNFICFNGFDVTNLGSGNNGTMDRCDTFMSWAEGGHPGCALSCTDFWHRFFGNVSGTIVLTDNESAQYFYEWNASGYNVYFTDVDSEIDWVSLQAVGQTTSNTSSSNDFTELDVAFNGTSFSDNIESTYSTDGSTPIATNNYEVFQLPINNVPVANSTSQNTTFQTGILWDTSDGGTEYSNSFNQSTVWVVSVNSSTMDAYGTYDYLIQVPYTLSDYEGNNSLVGIYLELQ
jgi:hypothetical protein